MTIDADDWEPVEQSQVDEPATTGSVPNAQASPQDDWEPVEGAQQAQGPDAQGAGGDDADDWEPVITPRGEWSQAGSAAAGVAKGAAPGVGGMAAGLYAGAATTAATAPVLGPAAPVAGVIAGLGVGLGAGTAISMAQDKFLALMGWDKDLDAAREANPNTFDIAEMAPAAALLRPNLKSLDLAARGIGAGIGAAAEAGMQTVRGDDYDLKKIGMAAGFGAAAPRTNRLGDKVLASGEQVGARYRGGNKNPDLKEIPPEREFTPTEEAQAPQEEDITVNNDIETTAAGVAAENHPVPETPGVGTPGQAAGSVAEAARPNDPTRNYQKDQPQNQPETTESKVIDTEPMKSDIKAALEADHPSGGEAPEASVPRPDGTDVLPQEAAPTNPEPLPNGHVSLTPEGAQPASRPSLEPSKVPTLYEDRNLLAQHGWDDTLRNLDKMPPKKQIEIARVAANMIRDEQAKATGDTANKEVRRPTGELRKESRRTVEGTNVIANSPAVAERAAKANKAYESVYDDFGPDSERGKAIDPVDVSKAKENREFTKEVWEEAKKRLGGDPFAKGSGVYVPNKRTPELNEKIQWLKAVKASALGQNHKNFMTLHSVKGMGSLDRQTGNIEGATRFEPQVSEKGAEIETAKNAEGKVEGREAIEPFTDPDQMESRVYGDQQKTLRDWVNNLDDTDYTLMKGTHPDLEQNIRSTQDPKELLQNFQDDLVEAQARRPKGEITTEVELPAKVEDLPHVEVLPEPKIPAYEATAEATREKTAKLRAARLAAKEAGTAPEPVKGKVAERMSDEEATTTTEPASFETLRKFAEDESAAGAKKFVQAMVQRMQQKQNRVAAAASAAPGPQANAAMKAYTDNFAHAVHENMRLSEAEVLHTMDDIRKLYDNAKVEVKKLGLTAKDMKAMDLAGQKDTLDTLPPDHKKFYDTAVRPLKDLYESNYKEIRALNDKYGLGLDLPDPSLRGIDVQYAPRHKEGTLLWDRSQDDMFDPFSNRGLSGYSRNLELRNLKALRDVGNDPTMSNMAGDRLIVSVDGDKKNGYEVTILRQGQKPVKLKNIPPGFDGNIGDVIPLKVKGKASRWQLDNAATDEIEKATGGTVKYVKDPMTNWAMAADSSTKALAQIKLRTDILSSHEFNNLTTKNLKEAEERGYDPKFTRLKEFGDRYMPKELKWLFDDYAKPGFGGDNAVDKLRAFNMGVAKFINVNAPLVHVWNEGVQVAVARGYRWIWPPSYYRIGRALPEAVRSVNKQDALQREMRNAGAHPQLAATLARGMHHDYAKLLGMDMTQNASKWDPVAKMFNMTTPQAFDKTYKLSSDVTWRLSDYMATAHYMELKAEGNTPKQAAAKLNKYFSTYQVGTTILGSRGLQQFLVDPATTLFGRYKANIFQSFKYMGEGMIKGTPAEKAEAFSQMVTLGALGLFGFSSVSKGLEKLTGIEGIELRPRGMAAFPAAIADVAQGRKGLAAAATQLHSPAPAGQAFLDLHNNKDFRGKDIFPQGNWLEHPSIPLEGAGKVAEYAARQFVSPYSSASQAYGRDDEEGGIKGAAKGFTAEQFGVSIPSERARNYEEKSPKINERNMNSRYKRPDSEGVIPGVIRRFTE